MIGQSVPMRRIMEAIERVAPARVSVFITGETGTGKEEAAKAIHERSGRTGPFVPVNCAAIIETLIESELFGHQKGSFTGADRRHPGLVERANGGTLFLDEISEMRSEAQAKLLRVIEERRVLPVGGTQEIPIDVRFLAASNRAPKQAIGDERLREDLYYRLCAATIHLPHFGTGWRICQRSLITSSRKRTTIIRGKSTASIQNACVPSKLIDGRETFASYVMYSILLC